MFVLGDNGQSKYNRYGRKKENGYYKSSDSAPKPTGRKPFPQRSKEAMDKRPRSKNAVPYNKPSEESDEVRMLYCRCTVKNFHFLIPSTVLQKGDSYRIH